MLAGLHADVKPRSLAPSFRDQTVGLASGSWGKAVLGKGEHLSARMAGVSA